MSRTDWSSDDPESITAALDRVYADRDSDPDPVVRASGAKTLRRVVWDEADQGSSESIGVRLEPG